ncbi:cysteine-rich CWC family protein [Acidaminobacter sp. JC074]|uniref:cysteine-rich CWC family protein n=1 Tax=Acidaminobacter sp. JC074 TaxID=2530199 RepID=UPI001F0E2566|nr:cysteine-rich CWC family protein [Acidaminobacter sp. JC074]
MIEKGKCPICGKTNQCAITLGEEPSTCWCMTTKVPKDLVSNIPDEFRNISCVCRECVKNYNKKVCVVGSLNVDHVLDVKNFPKPGETIKASKLSTFFGGKGGNQATACSKLGLTTSMLGSVGSDGHGNSYIEHFTNMGVNTNLIHQSNISGQAFIQVDQEGENNIVTIGGANYDLSIQWIDDHLEEILEHDVFLFSLEIPQDLVLYLMEILEKHHKLIILDPAPFANFHVKMLDYTDYITPNNSEYEQIKSYLKPSHHVIVKRGEKGSKYIHNEISINIPPYPVKAIDTVGAGDTFNAAFCFALVFNYTIEDALMTSNIAGAMATTKPGAQTGMPSLQELLRIRYK